MADASFGWYRTRLIGAVLFSFGSKRSKGNKQYFEGTIATCMEDAGSDGEVLYGRTGDGQGLGLDLFDVAGHRAYHGGGVCHSAWLRLQQIY